MTFKFGLLKVLSIINLVVSSGLVLLAALSLLMSVSPTGLVLIFFMGAAAIHSWLGLSLHRSLRTGEPLDEQKPTGLRVIGFITAFAAFMCMASCITFLRAPENLVREAVQPILDQQPKGPGAFTLGQLEQLVRGMAVAMLIYAISLMVNYIMSMNFLQVYLHQRRGGQDDDNGDGLF